MNGGYFYNRRRCVAAFCIIFGFNVGFWCCSISPGLAANIDRITGPEAVQRLQQVLGDPATFEQDMRDSTRDFIADHFGSMAIAAAFGIAIRMRS